MRYAVINEDGFVGLIGSSPELPAIEVGQRLVVPADGILPRKKPLRVDLRRIPDEVNYVESFDRIVANVQPKGLSAASLLEIKRVELISSIDQQFAARIASIRGPLADLHAEKRRQAEAGGGPLVADEADRLAILANAEAVDQRVAAIDRERRDVKARLRAATTMEELQHVFDT